jgi:hypothetical protein
MYIDNDSFEVNGVKIGPYITQIEYQYPKLWGDDTGRNLAGNFNGTLIGVFPKFIVTFHKLTNVDIQVLAPILDSKYQTVKYMDPVLRRMNTKQTYTGDWSVVYKDVNKEANNITISFICTSKR